MKALVYAHYTVIIEEHQKIQERNPFVAYPSFMVILTSVLLAVLGYLFNPVLVSRPLGPEGISSLGVFFSLCMFLMFPQRPLDTFLIRYTAIQQAQGRPENIRGGMIQCLKTSLGLSTLLSGTVLVFSQPLKDWLRLESPGPIFDAVAFTYLFVFQTVLRSVLQGLKWYGKYSVSLLVEPVCRLAVGLLLLGIGLTVRGAIAANLIASVCSTLCAFWFLKPLIRKQIISQKAEPLSWKGLPGMFLYALCIASSTSIDVLMAKHYFPAAESGLFIAASTLAKVSFVVIYPIAQVAYSFFCEAAAKNEKTGLLLWKSAGLLVLGFALLLLPVMLFPGEIIRVTYGEKFSGAAPLLIHGFLAFVPFSFISLLCNYFLAKHRESFVYGLCAGSLLQFFLITWFHTSLAMVFWAYAAGGIAQLALSFLAGLRDRRPSALEAAA